MKQIEMSRLTQQEVADVQKSLAVQQARLEFLQQQINEKGADLKANESLEAEFEKFLQMKMNDPNMIAPERDVSHGDNIHTQHRQGFEKMGLPFPQSTQAAPELVAQ